MTFNVTKNKAEIQIEDESKILVRGAAFFIETSDSRRKLSL